MSPSKASKLRLLCDENIPKKVIELLQEYKFDIKRPSAGTTDEEVAALAKREKRILVTFDRIFGNTLRFVPENYWGIILIRIRPPLINTVLNALSNVFTMVSPNEFKGKLFTVASFGFKIFPRNGRFGWIKFSPTLKS